MDIVAKIGTSSLTDARGEIRRDAIAKLCDEVAGLRADGHRVVVVTSGAIGAGLPALGLGGDRRPRDAVTLQALSAVGQSRLMGVYDDELGRPRPRRRARCCSPRSTSSSAVSTSRPGAPCCACSSWAWCRRQRERRHRRRRDPLRRQRPHRRPRRPPHRGRPARAAHRHARPALGRSPPRPVGLADRGDRRDRQGASRRWPAVPAASAAAAAWRRRWRRPRSRHGRVCAR